MTRQVRLNLLEDAGTGAGSWMLWPGGKGLLLAEGTISDADLEIQSPNGTALVLAEVNAVGTVEFDAPPGEIRMNVTTGSSIYAYAVTIPTY